MKALLKSLEMNLESVSETSIEQAQEIIKLKEELANLKRSTSNEIENLKQQLRCETNVKKAYKGQLETFKQHLGI